MTILEVLKKHPYKETDALLAFVLNKSVEFIFIESHYTLSKKEVSVFNSLVKKLKKNQPLAYLLGFGWFFNYKILLNKHTLIPRPETEELVDLIKNTSKNPYKKIIDIGTGSGCIAIALKDHFKKANVTATDNNKEALKLAKKNARANKTKIIFKHSNLFKNITGSFDLVVANLPYVPKNVYLKNINSIKYEPKKAIILPPNNFFSNFLSQCLNHTTPTGSIYLEICKENISEIKSFCKKNNLNLQVHKDLRKKPRFCIIRLVAK